MIYFVPAWYHNAWRENEQIWYIRRTQSEVDETLKQIQLFHRKKAYPFRILVTGFAPNLRHYLHRQGIFHVGYWSCFDAIGCIRRKKAAVISFHNLNWPVGIEFIYTPFAVVAMLHGQKYAQIEFGEDGNPIQIDIYRRNTLSRRNLYDDRGFIGSTSVYENGVKQFEQYLDEAGTWKICQFADGHVTVNPKSNFYLLHTEAGDQEIPYEKLSYPGIEDVIREVFSRYIRMTAPEDIFCLAMHPNTVTLAQDVLADRKTILTFYGKRMELSSDDAFQRMLEQASYLVADSELDAQRIHTAMRSEPRRLTSVPPFDSRMDFGSSLQIEEQRVLVPVDNLAEGVLDRMLPVLMNYMKRNPNVRVHLFTRNAAYNRKNQVLDQARKILEAHGLDPEYASAEEAADYRDALDLEEAIPLLFRVEQCVDELSVSKCMRYQRLLVDMEPVPDLFLQISCVSMGIPQIVTMETEYIHSGKNGVVTTDIESLDEKLAYYLDSMTHWNQALIHSYEISKQYTTERLVAQWQEIIETVEKGN